MLQLSASLLHRPIISLRTHQAIATTVQPIINPDNLKIEGFFCHEPRGRGQLVLLHQDIRDILPQGFIVNDYDSLSDPEDIVRLQKLIDLNFSPLNKHVVTSSKKRIGKVNDYATDIDSMYIQKLYVAQSLLKNFAGGSLGIDRKQIVEITDKRIIVHDLLQHTPVNAPVAA